MSARRSTLVSCALVCACLAVLCHRSIWYGEIFSPADLLYSFYPWSYDGPRIDPSNPTRSDEAFVHQPLMATHWARLSRGEVPAWDPSRLGGSQAFLDGLNDGQIFSPFSLPFYLLSPEAAVTVSVPIRLAAAALLMWMFLGTLRLSPPARLAGAVAFAFNGVFIVWLSAPIPTIALFLPLTCLLADRVVATGRALPAAGLAIALGVQFTGSYLPTSIAVVAVTMAYGAWLAGSSPERRGRAMGLMAAAALLGLAIGALALGPMLATLFGSPVSTRASTSHALPIANLVTFALPDFWGNPASRTWWYPGDGNYPEFVSYLGVSTLMLAGTGVAAFAGRDRRVLFFSLLAVLVLLYVYAIPPIGWLRDVLFLRSMNAQRWMVAVAFAVPCLAAYGVEWVEWMLRTGKSGADPQEPGPPMPRLPVAGAVAMAAVLGIVVVSTLASYLPDIRARSLQPLEKAQLARFAVIAAGTCLLVALPGLRRHATRPAHRWSAVLPWTAATLVGVDLVSFGSGFNPTVSGDRYYPKTPGIRAMQDMAQGTRIAFVGDHRHFPHGHVWSMYGLSSLTGFDFAGDQAYQQFLAKATGQPYTGPRFGFLDIPQAAALDLRLLGLLGTELIVCAPEDVATAGGGYDTVGEIIGQTIRQTFRATANGLRRVDVLAATFGRRNRGTLTVQVVDDSDERMLAERTFKAREVPNNDWLVVDLPEEPSSAGRSYSIRVRADGAVLGEAVTLWGTVADGFVEGSLQIDGRDTGRDLWFRTFATPPHRSPPAHPLFAPDLNVYRNPHALPRAWFVEDAEVLAWERQLDRLVEDGFDPRRTALIEQAPGTTPTAGATVIAVSEPTPDERVVDVSAPSGGLLVVNERHHRGWHASIDGAPARVMRADHLLMALELPRGARQVRLWFASPLRAPSWTLSFLALAVALLARFRWSR